MTKHEFCIFCAKTHLSKSLKESAIAHGNGIGIKPTPPSTSFGGPRFKGKLFGSKRLD